MVVAGSCARIRSLGLAQLVNQGRQIQQLLSQDQLRQASVRRWQAELELAVAALELLQVRVLPREQREPAQAERR
jgi:hypothetical protein